MNIQFSQIYNNQPLILLKELENKYKNKLESKLIHSEQMRNNKLIFHIFLDKVFKFIPKTQPNGLLLTKYEGGSSAFASRNLSHCLMSVKEDPKIHDTSKMIISKWLKTIQTFITYATILDGMRSTSTTLFHYIMNIKDQNPNNKPKIHLNIPASEIQLLILSIVAQIQQLKPDEEFMLPAGSIMHETILSLKTNNGLYQLSSYNTGDGAKYNETVRVIPNLSIDKLDETFWKNILLCKLNHINMTKFNQLLDNLDPSHLQCLDSKLVHKTQQDSDTCSFRVQEAKLRADFVLGFPDPKEGLEQYKIIKSLMRNFFISNIQFNSDLDPIIWQEAQKKAKTYERYLLWLDDDFENLTKLEKDYKEAINFLSPLQSKKLVKKIQESLSMENRLKRFQLLHRKLVKVINEKNLKKAEITILFQSQPSFQYLQTAFIKAQETAYLNEQLSFMAQEALKEIKSPNKRIFAKVYSRFLKLNPSFLNETFPFKKYCKYGSLVEVIETCEILVKSGFLTQELLQTDTALKSGLKTIPKRLTLLFQNREIDLALRMARILYSFKDSTLTFDLNKAMAKYLTKQQFFDFFQQLDLPIFLTNSSFPFNDYAKHAPIKDVIDTCELFVKHNFLTQELLQTDRALKYGLCTIGIRLTLLLQNGEIDLALRMARILYSFKDSILTFNLNKAMAKYLTRQQFFDFFQQLNLPIFLANSSFAFIDYAEHAPIKDVIETCEILVKHKFLTQELLQTDRSLKYGLTAIPERLVLLLQNGEIDLALRMARILYSFQNPILTFDLDKSMTKYLTKKQFSEFFKSSIKNF